MKKENVQKEETHEAILELRKKYGADVLTRADEGYPPIEAIPTGCFAIDRVIGCGGLPRGRILELYGEPSCQPADSKVLMANGDWKLIQDIKIGDIIISPQQDGTTIPAKVLNTTNWIAPLTFDITKNSDDSLLYSCSGNHIIPHFSWNNIKIEKSRESISVTQLHQNTALELEGKNKINAFISPTITWMQNKEDPIVGGYTLGLCLANGNIASTGGIKICCHEDDLPIEVLRMKEEGTLLSEIVKYKSKEFSKASQVTLIEGRPLLQQMQWFQEQGLRGKNGHNKFIPKDALLSSVEYRKNLLAGLIDGDGSLSGDKRDNKNNHYPRARYEYSTVSKKLAKDIQFLVSSLGGIATIAERVTHCNNKPFLSYRLYIAFDFSIDTSLWRKKGFGPRNSIKNMREKLSSHIGINIKKSLSPKTVYGFVIDSPSQWYVTDNWIVTHNSGKTATTLFLIAQVQKTGGTCAFLDAEYSFNGDFARSIGVDTKKLFISQPATLEEGADTIRALVATNQIDVIVIDSVAALVPKKEVEGEEMLANSMAVQAQLMSKMLRVLTGEVARSKTCVIFINHLKEKMGIFWGDKSTTPGGKSLKFFASVRLAVSRGEKFKGEHDEQIGNMVTITAQKNKVAPPWRKGSFALYYATGVDQTADTFDTAFELGLVTKEGMTYSYGEQKLAIGRDKSIEVLKSLPDIYKKLRSATTEAVKKEK